MKLLAAEQEILNGMVERRPDLKPCVEKIMMLHQELVRCYDNGGKLLTCGNGGSAADAMHIVGELCKSFARRRPLRAELVIKLQDFPMGTELARHLEIGLPAITLGQNDALRSAIENDSPLRHIGFAQEACALGKPGDVLIALSTSGNAQNCLMAMSIAKAVGIRTVSLTGPDGGQMAPLADLAIKAPGATTPLIQEAHEAIYHTFCLMIEAHYFPEMR